MYNTVLFDLDGTLIDSAEGITKCTQYALEKFNIEVTDRKDLYPFIGPPLKWSFMEYYGFDEEKADLAVEYYRERFSVKGMYEHQVYDGIEELLKMLKERKVRLGVASSKNELYVKLILEDIKLDQYFDVIAGSLDEERSGKTEVIEAALSQWNIQDKSEIVMIGDRKFDIIGAKETELDSIGVLVGFGTREELEDAGADQIVASIWDLKEYLDENCESYEEKK
ncbi:MAG TPA: HAD-IA family hydrolase [Candidatus Merdenecus merdavium]|nr:HAD-IA family hydrolase [Candidatus Merdenecus merdavium]